VVEANKHTGTKTYFTTTEFLVRIRSLGLETKRVVDAIDSPKAYYESDHAWFYKA
jgi:hypothetical protein